MQESWHSHSVAETLKIATGFAARLRSGACIALQGDLGSGKTCFAKGVISKLSGLDVKEITSPTFTLVEEYPGTRPLFHVDLYRMKDAAEAGDLAWDDILAPGAIALIEWPERLEKIIPYCQYRLIFSKAGETERRIELHAKETQNAPG